MYRSRLPLFIACLSLFSIIGLAVGTEQAPLGTVDYSLSSTALEISRGNLACTSVSLASPDVIVEDQVVDFATYQVFAMPGEPFIMEEGNPAVPQVSRFYRIPNTGGVDLLITNSEFELMDNVNPLPYKIEGDESFDLVQKSAVFDRDEWYPPNVAEISEPMIMRDFRVVRVVLYPVQVNPVTHQARVYHQLSVDVVANNQPGVNELTTPGQITPTWVPIYRNLLPNLDDDALTDLSPLPGNFMIFSKPGAFQWADSLRTWKKRMGYVVTVDTTHVTAATIITTIRNAYTNPETRPEFVCLIGDPDWSNGLPVDGNNFDHSYALGNTGDDLEDIGVGRLSGSSTSEMATINAKTMGYERNPHMANGGVADTMWYHRGFFYAGICATWNIRSNFTAMRWGAQQFRNWTGVDSTYVQTFDCHWNLTTVQNYLNLGVSFFLIRPSWQFETDMPINNNPTWRLPIAFIYTCNANDYNGGTGYAEEWVREGTPTAPRGVAACIGTSTSGTHAPENVTVTGGTMYGIANLGIEHFSNVMISAKLWLTLLWGAGSNSAFYFSRYNNLMGEPSLSIWTDVPKVMQVDHPAALDVGTHYMGLDVSLDANGLPVEDALVVLWKGTETYVRGRTDESGHIDLPISINTPGNLLVTVTKRNHKPYLATVTCGTVAQSVGLSSFTIDDDNSGGTIGNDNDTLNPAETIDLPLYLRNYGNATTATGVTATISSDDPRVTVINPTSTFANMAPGDSALSATPFRIHSDADLQNEEHILLTLTITASSLQTQSAFELVSYSGEPSYVSHTFTGTVNPGSTNNLRVTLRNVGALPLTGTTGQLISLSPFVQVDDGGGTFGDIPINQNATNTADQFSLTSNSLTFRGHQAPVRMILTTSSGYVDSVLFTVTIGTAAGSDPTGPDAYGYYAYDNTDVSYEMHPTFSYVNLSAGLGQDLNLNDPGEPPVQNPWITYSVVRALPFPFTFYGQTYDTVTICSNGWLAFGNQGLLDLFRNYPLPAMLAPDAMVAPYWDDLRTDGADGVWTYFDAANHRYIVQWKARVFDGSTALDFEVILLDEDEYPTFDGNGKVLVQYNDVTMGVPGDYREPSGCTIGIQAPRSLVALQYAFLTTYMPGSATIADGRAVLYTTDARMLFGDIVGTVRDAETNLPLPAADVTIDGYAYHDLTDGSGQYTLENVLIGSYTVRAHKRAFNDTTAANVLVELDSTETVNFLMRHPEFALSRDTISISLPEEPVQTSFDIINGGNGPLDYSITVTYAGDDSPNPWDMLSTVNVSSSTGDMQIQGCEFVGDYWWITGGAGASGGRNFYKFDTDGNYAGAIPQPGSGSFGWFDMAYDGQYVYGSDSHVIIGVDQSGAPQVTINSPLNPTRALAYDPATDHFWIADFSSDIYEINRQGETVHTVANSDSLLITGMAWYAADPDGYKLYIFCQNHVGGGNQTQLWRMHPASRDFELVTTLEANPGDHAGGLTITPGWNSTVLALGGILQNTTGDRLGIYEITFNTTWIDVNPSQNSVNGGSAQEVTITIDPSILRSDVYRIHLNIASQVLDTTYVLPVVISVTSGVSPSEQPGLPANFALYQNFPNPFNPETGIRFDLPQSGLVELRIYNTLGQLIRTLLNESRTVGSHLITWDGRSDFGETVATGVYIYQLHSGPFTAAKKMVFVR